MIDAWNLANPGNTYTYSGDVDAYIQNGTNIIVALAPLYELSFCDGSTVDLSCLASGNTDVVVENTVFVMKNGDD